MGYFNIFISQNLTKDCGNYNCKLCSKIDKSNCYLCNNEYNFIGNKKICKKDISTTIFENPIETTIAENPIETTIIDSIKTTIIQNEIQSNMVEIYNTQKIIKNYNKIINGCNIEDLIKNKCLNLTLTNEEFKEIYNYIKDEILYDNYNQENLVIQTLDVIFQLSKY